jgi:hypothetical protein
MAFKTVTPAQAAKIDAELLAMVPEMEALGMGPDSIKDRLDGLRYHKMTSAELANRKKARGGKRVGYTVR